MTRSPFEPIGERPRWEIVYDELTTLNIGDTLSYERLCALLEVTDRGAVRQPVYAARKQWAQTASRWLVSVPNVGYRVVDAHEHEAIAKGHHRSARRQIRRGRQVLAAADRGRLDDEQRRRVDDMEITFGRHEDVIRRIDGRGARVDQAVAQAKLQIAVTDDRLTALEDALQRHGIATEVTS